MRTILKFVTLLAGVGLSASAVAVTTPIDEVPMGNASSTAVSPNIMFVLDDSGSMCWTVLPDDAQFGGGLGGGYPAAGGNCSDTGFARYAGGSAKYGPVSSHCNGVFYDPTKLYQLPVYSDNSQFPSAVVGTTAEDGYTAYTPHDTSWNVVAPLSKSGGGVVTGNGATAFSLPAAGTTVTIDVTGCPAGSMGSVPGVYPPNSGTTYSTWVTNITATPANGYYPTALMLYVNGETGPAPENNIFLGAHRAFGTYESCNATTKKLTLKITHSVGGAFSTASSNWRIARIPFTYQYTGSETDIDFTYNPDGSLKTGSTFYTECNNKTGALPAKFTFTPVVDLQNHANWFSYYRTRINTMKTAMALAFGNMVTPEKFRVGYSTINYRGVDNTDYRFLDVGDYCDATTNCSHRQTFFSRIFSARASGNTPLRNALSKAGLIFAGKLLTGTRDPVEHSCQKNFTILSTDGYWNEGSTAWNTGGGTPYDNGGFRIPAGGCTGDACYALKKVGDQDSSATSDFLGYDTALPTAMVPPQVDKSNAGAGVANTLADVSMYYYKTVLRSIGFGNCVSGSTAENLCPAPGNVPVSAKDCNRYPHMNTFTIGLGVQGVLDSEGYLAGASSDYSALAAGSTQWPTVPTAGGDVRTVDDLWHTAVNGRGEYYSAKSSASIVSSLAKALAAIAAASGTGGAAGASGQQLTTSSSNVYLARYSGDSWSGDVLSLKIDPATGTLLSNPGDPSAVCSAAPPAGDPDWSAQKQLDDFLTADPDASTRKIYMVTGGGLGNFESANLPSPPSPEFDPSTLSQYGGFSPTEKAQATKDNLVAYLRGVSSYDAGPGKCCEDQSGNAFRLFRDRDHALGDIVASSPYYVGKAPFRYGDTGYASYRDSVTASRRAVVYVGANDGMLHALDAGVPPDMTGTGSELWAFVPTAVLSKLKRLADFTYVANHRFFVNGPMNVGDVQDSGGNWHSLLVGALGAGGRDYYALDVTDPSNPKLAWEFSTKNPAAANNLGYTFGAPLITKDAKTGKWVVLLSSGFNNAPPDAPSGDGRGRLFVVDAMTGVLLKEILTAAPADASRSGIAGIANWVDNSSIDNITQHVYGGDLDGNLWRFDISTETVDRLAYFEVGGQRQPITRRPELGEVTAGAAKSRYIFVSTGKALTADDLDGTKPAGTSLQSFYAVRDDLLTTYGSPFASVSGVVPLDLTAGGSGRELKYAAVGSSAPGWYFHFDVSSGERVTTDIFLQIGWLAFGTTTPSTSATVCDAALTAYSYFIDYNPQSSKVSLPGEIVNAGSGGSAGVSIVQTVGGAPVGVFTRTTGEISTFTAPETASGTVRRVSWRELIK